jgi:hypothetical protein
MGANIDVHEIMITVKVMGLSIDEVREIKAFLENILQNQFNPHKTKIDDFWSLVRQVRKATPYGNPLYWSDIHMKWVTVPDSYHGIDLPKSHFL